MAAAPTRITTRACGWATIEPLSQDGSGMRRSRSTRKPSRMPTIQRPGGPPHNIQEYGRFHQISVAQASAWDAASAVMTWIFRTGKSGRLARGTVTDVEISRVRKAFRRPAVTQFPSWTMAMCQQTTRTIRSRNRWTTLTHGQ
jgi:hypothetical protein